MTTTGPAATLRAMIRLHFPNPDDSPTQRTPVRVRYAIERQADGRTVPVLRYGHGTGQLSGEAWQGFRAAGATIEAGTERERGILREVLGADCLPVTP